MGVRLYFFKNEQATVWCTVAFVLSSYLFYCTRRLEGLLLPSRRVLLHGAVRDAIYFNSDILRVAAKLPASIR